MDKDFVCSFQVRVPQTFLVLPSSLGSGGGHRRSGFKGWELGLDCLICAIFARQRSEVREGAGFRGEGLGVRVSRTEELGVQGSRVGGEGLKVRVSSCPQRVQGQDKRCRSEG